MCAHLAISSSSSSKLTFFELFWQGCSRILIQNGVILISNPAVFFLTVNSYSLFRFLRDLGHKTWQGKMPNHLFYEFRARQWAGTMILFSRISSQRALMWPVRHPFEAILGASPCPPVKGCNLLREEVHNRSTTDEQVRNSSSQRKVKIQPLYNS